MRIRRDKDDELRWKKYWGYSWFKLWSDHSLTYYRLVLFFHLKKEKNFSNPNKSYYAISAADIWHIKLNKTWNLN